MGFDLRRGLFIDPGEGDRNSATLRRVKSELLVSAEQAAQVLVYFLLQIIEGMDKNRSLTPLPSPSLRRRHQLRKGRS